MTAIEITHHYDDVLQQILAEVKGLREDLKPKQVSVKYDIRAKSTEDAFIRAQRKERERVTVGGRSMPGVHETIMAELVNLYGLLKKVDADSGVEPSLKPGPHRKVLDEYMRALDAKPRNCAPFLDLPLDERAGRAFGIDRRTYNRYAAGLAAALDIPHASASAVLDGLALVAGGAQ